MTRLTSSIRVIVILAGASLLAPACNMEVDGDGSGDEDLGALEGVSQGAQAYNQGTFNGNGTTCKTCHPVGSGTTNTGTLNPGDVQKLFKKSPHDALFQGDRADTIGGTTFNRVQARASILIDLPLPSNVSIVGSSARNVIWARGIPTTNDTPALDPVLMYDGRDPDLQTQAAGAIAAHAAGSGATQQNLDDIAAFQRTLFNRNNLKQFAQNGTPLSMPLGVTDAEKRGRRWFIDDGKTSPGDVGESKFNVCGFCHSGDMLNGLSGFFVANVAPPGFAEGDRFFTVLVSEFNEIGNPTQVFRFDNGGVITDVESPDLGIFRVFGEPPPIGNGFFKIPTVWGVKDTAPYFHDNSALDLVQLMNHYDDAIFVLSETDPVPPTLGQVDLTEQNKADIIAYMKLL